MDSPTPTQAIGKQTHLRTHMLSHKIDAKRCITHTHTHNHLYVDTDRLLLLSRPPAPASPFSPALTNSLSTSAPSVHSQHSVIMAGFFGWISVGHTFHLFLHYEFLDSGINWQWAFCTASPEITCVSTSYMYCMWKMSHIHKLIENYHQIILKSLKPRLYTTCKSLCLSPV